MDDDGFVTIRGGGAGAGSALVNEVTFSAALARFPEGVVAGMPRRLTWAWNGNGTLRARFADDGLLSVTRREPYRSYATSAMHMQKVTGLTLRGRYPITKVEGTDVFIDVSSAVRNTEGGTA